MQVEYAIGVSYPGIVVYHTGECFLVPWEQVGDVVEGADGTLSVWLDAHAVGLGNGAGDRLCLTLADDDEEAPVWRAIVRHARGQTPPREW